MANISIITPAGPLLRNGNRHTALRWAAFLRKAGHRVNVAEAWSGEAADIMIALHARRSHSSIARFRHRHPQRPLVVALTGTDVYRDLPACEDAQQSLEWSDLLIVLQSKAPDRLPAGFRDRTRVVYQSAPAIHAPPRSRTFFDVAVVGHLRDEKDPFRSAFASVLLPEASRIRIRHYGKALDPRLGEEALRLSAECARYEWVGEFPRWHVRRRIAASHLLVVSSRMEGGANVICEALSASTPVIASRVDGNIGMLGDDYVGYFECGDENALGELLWRAESDPRFYARLQAQCVLRRPLMEPAREASALSAVVAEALALRRQKS